LSDLRGCVPDESDYRRKRERRRISLFLGQSETGWVCTVSLVTTAFTVNNLIAFSIWALIGDKITGYFKPPDSTRKPNTMFGVVLAAVAVWMVQS